MPQKLHVRRKRGNVKQQMGHRAPREPNLADAEPLAGSGFEDEQPETDFNGDSEESAEPEREDEQS